MYLTVVWTWLDFLGFMLFLLFQYLSGCYKYSHSIFTFLGSSLLWQLILLSCLEGITNDSLHVGFYIRSLGIIVLYHKKFQFFFYQEGLSPWYYQCCGLPLLGTLEYTSWLFTEVTHNCCLGQRSDEFIALESMNMALIGICSFQWNAPASAVMQRLKVGSPGGNGNACSQYSPPGGSWTLRGMAATVPWGHKGSALPHSGHLL